MKRMNNKLSKVHWQSFLAFPPALLGALKTVPYFQLFMYLPFILQDFAVIDLAITLSSHIVLYFLFIKIFWHKGSAILGYLAVLLVVAIITSFYSLSCLVFFSYAAAACTAYREKYPSLILLFLVVSVYLICAYLNEHSIPVLLVGLFFTAVNGLSFMYQLNKYLQERVIKQSRIETISLAKVDERERIARDLHDLLGNSLTSITLKAELIERLVLVDPSQVKQHIEDIKKISRDTLSEVRDMVSDYRSNSLSNELACAKVTLEAKDIALFCDIQKYEISAEVEAALAMVVRESITNIVRHSKATQCRITLSYTRDTRNSSYFKLQLDILDNGSIDNPLKFGNGIQGMRERVAKLKGNFDIDSTAGCLIKVKLKLKPAEQQK